MTSRRYGTLRNGKLTSTVKFAGLTIYLCWAERASHGIRNAFAKVVTGFEFTLGVYHSWKCLQLMLFKDIFLSTLEGTRKSLCWEEFQVPYSMDPPSCMMYQILHGIERKKREKGIKRKKQRLDRRKGMTAFQTQTVLKLFFLSPSSSQR